MGKVLNVGKLDSDVLERVIFKNIIYKRSEVKVKPGIGEDCAVVDFGAYDCVMSTDPITASVKDIGRLAIHISCNDIASNGVEPLGLMLVVMLPVGTTEEQVASIMQDAAAAAARCCVEIIGGHTEVTPVVSKPVIISTAIGRAAAGRSQSAQTAEAGDGIYMTKYAGIEGTGILAGDFAERLEGILGPSELAFAHKLLDEVSVVKEGVAAGKIGTHGMHDITEGGILGAVWEVCNIAGLGCEIFEESIPVLDVTKKICAHFDINYLRLISSGCMLIVAPHDKEAELCAAVEGAGVKITKIGVTAPKENGLKIISADGQSIDIAPPSADELYKCIQK